MKLLSEFLCGDYYIKEEGYIISGDTDCMVWNVMEMEGGDRVKYDDYHECYYMEGYPSDLVFLNEDDIVCHDYGGEYYSSEDDVGNTYTECDNNTVIWIHPVKSGSVCLDVNTFEVSGDENSRYDTPSSYVIVDGVCHPLDCRDT